jgi:hypothetical protein
MGIRFKQFILNESQAYLGQKVGDILTAIQELNDDAGNMGTRDLIRFSERIANQIRRVLHSNWPREEKKHLSVLQKVGVALMKAIEEKDDLKGIIAGSSATLEKLVSDLGIPIHKLATTDNAPSTDKEGVNKSEKAQVTQPSPPPPDQSVAPQSPQTIDQAGPETPPVGGTGQEMMAPSLGGNSGPLDAF